MTADTSETQGQGAVIGGWICLALGAAFLFWSRITFVLYMPLFFAAFVLGIVAIAQNRIWHGIPILLLSVVLPLVIGFGLANHETQQALELFKKPLNSSTSETNEISDDPLQMRYGKLKVVNSGSGMRIELNGKIINDISNDRIDLHNYFKLKNRDVILISEDCGGSGCGQPSYFFITIAPDGNYTKSESFSGGNMSAATQQEEIITVIFKRYIDKSIESTITYNEGNLFIEKFDSRPTEGSAAEENCKGLYELYEDCTDLCSADKMCMASQRNFDFYSQDKRLKTDSFDKLCGAACKTKKIISYKEFKKEICGY